MSSKIKFILIFLSFAPWIAWAEPLPQPLSLPQALALVSQNPQQAIVLANNNKASAKVSLAKSKLAIRADINLIGRWLKASQYAAVYTGNSDHQAELRINKPLYDLSLSQQHIAAEQQQQAQIIQGQSQTEQLKLKIMQAYFQVLLADLDAQVNEEAIAVAYIRLDKAQTRQQLGQLAELEVAKLKYSYEKIRQQQHIASNQQRLSREQLANILNYPSEPPADLIEPKFNYLMQSLPPLEQVQAYAQQHNRGIIQRKAALAAQTAKIKAARAQGYPKLEANMRWFMWENQYGARDDARIDLQLNIPLYTGGHKQATLALANSERQRLQAELAQYQLQLRDQVLDLWFKIEQQQRQQETLDSQQNWRDLALDKTRSRYDLELQSDLGTALVEQSRVSLQQQTWRYQLALDWQQLAILLAQSSLPLQLETAS